MRTLIFQIHKPTQHTTAVLHRALRMYTHAARAVLSAAQRDWADVQAAALYNERLSTMNLARELRMRYRPRTMSYPLHGSLRDALFADLAAALTSYAALAQEWDQRYARAEQKARDAGFSIDPPSEEWAALLEELGERPGWPTAPRVTPDWRGYEDALERLTMVVPDMEQPRPSQRAPRIQLSEPISIGTRPLWFPRADGAGHNRNFALVKSARDARYYALLYLLPARDRRARPRAVPPPSGKRGALIAVHPDATALLRKERAASAVLVPLACGAWHERVLRYADEHPEAVRTARLFYRPASKRFGRPCKEWFGLAITFALPDGDPIECRTSLGVSMREDASVGWSVTDEAGNRLAYGELCGLCDLQTFWRQRRRYAARDGKIPPRAHHLQAEQVRHATHRIANTLVTLAQAWASQVVVDDVRYLRQLVLRPPRQEDGSRQARTPAWHDAVAERHYRRATLVIGTLESILAYKLPSAGLPAPLSAGGISPRDCPACGQRGKALDVCSLCGSLIGAAGTAWVTAKQVPLIRARQAAARARRAQQASQDETESVD